MSLPASRERLSNLLMEPIFYRIHKHCVVRRFGLLLLLFFFGACSFAEAADSFVSRSFSVEEESRNGAVLSWSFPREDIDSPQRILLSIPHGVLEDPQLLDYGTEPVIVNSPTPEIIFRELGVMRSCRVGMVSVPSVTYVGGVTARIRYVTGRIRIPWNDKPRRVSAPDHPVERILDAYLLNEGTRFDLQSDPPNDLPIPAYRRGPSVRLLAKGERAVAVGSFAWSKVAGENPSIDQVAVIGPKGPVPFIVWTADRSVRTEGELQQEDRILFWTDESDSPYSPFSSYWLCEDPKSSRLAAPPSREEDSSAETSARCVVSLEQDRVFFPEGHRDRRQHAYWGWDEITSETPVALPIPVLPYPAAATFSLEIGLLSKDGLLSSDMLSFSLNQTPIEMEVENLPTRQFATAKAIVSTETLRGTTSTLRIAAANDIGSPVYLDTVRLDYRRQTEYSGGMLRFSPAPGSYRLHSSYSSNALIWLIEPEGGVVSSQVLKPGENLSLEVPDDHRIVVLDPSDVGYADLLSHMPPVSATDPSLVPPDQTDIIIVAPEVFHSTLQKLIRHYRSRGMRSHVVSVKDIYSVFGDGRLSPEPIKDYLRWLYERNPVRCPAYVLLVGDATWDYWGKFRNGIVNLVPAYRGTADYPDENWFVSLTRSDSLPEMLIGRFAVRTPKELEVMIQKLIAYNAEKPAAWMNRVLLVTDNDFENEVNELYTEWLPPGYETSEVRLADYPFRDNYYLPEDARRALKAKTSPQATDAVIERLNEGVVLWEYFGHGAPNVMGHERIFFAGGSKFSDAKRLSNKDELPLLWAFTCQTGNFDYAEEKWNISIAEDLLTRPEGGVIAALVATGRGFPRDHLVLARGLHDAVFRRGLRGTAQSFAASCLLALIDNRHFEPQEQFCILGDPTFELPVPKAWPETAESKIVFDSVGTLQYSFASPGEDAGGRVWLRDGNHETRWEDPLEPADWPTEGNLEFSELLGADWRREETASFGLAALLPSGLVHGGTVIVLPPPAAPETIGSGSPNLTILEKDIRLRPPYPENGMTIFFDVPVANTGSEVSSRSILRGVLFEPGEKERVLENFVGRNEPFIPALVPGATRVITARWDPIENSGEHTIRFECDPWNRIDEPDEADNVAEITVDVRKKADLLVEPSDIEYRHDSDEDQFVIDFTVHNVGETDARQVLIQVAVGFEGPTPEQSGVLDVWEVQAGKLRKGYNLRVTDRAAWFRVTADPDEMIDEETHKNNSAKVDLEIPQ